MYAFRSEYDRGVNTFSPEGRLFQVEYAMAAMKLGSTAVGIKTEEGVVLASERRITSTLLEPSSVEKIMDIDTHVGCCMSGLVADAKTMIDHARVEAQNYFFTYDEQMPVESVVQTISDLALDFSDIKEKGKKKTMSRPFGVALIIAGADKDGKSTLWVTDPSGTYTQFTAASIGTAQEGAESMLIEQYHSNMTLKEAENLALIVLRQVMEDKINSTNVEMASVTNGKFNIYRDTSIQEILDRLPPPTHITPAQLS
ncbi:proteasome subunit alpha type 5, putative [Cryptosporidium muris RN66]|uniref:Proteasome subunit alpha type n=1 Tax=Cryptosporidium muris (strain RN66) TaxID=441375 RepID=B6A9P1_CRYMR|nr:proteasome subunit alpha type 5, putative [Cryptosporidium muris RN66]EEA04932.1 proteasome subunit alpha type 5, putative [Cryptosporidium muris RN66]|eukprot:XP_002139281.1 proteasome subunit alpha type 5 [Cryptosporidium muris RN66]